MSMKSLLLASLLPLSILLSACDKPSTDTQDADSSAVDAIQIRQDTMQGWRDASDIMGEMIDNPDSFDAAIFEEQAQFLADDASNPWQHFANAEEVGDATEAVWSKPDEFKKEAALFEQATAHLSTTAKTASEAADVKTAYADVKASCKSCHQTFKN